jgi:hypothetical protein
LNFQKSIFTELKLHFFAKFKAASASPPTFFKGSLDTLALHWKVQIAKNTVKAYRIILTDISQPGLAKKSRLPDLQSDMIELCLTWKIAPPSLDAFCDY